MSLTIFVANVGKPPNVAQIHAEADDGQEEFDFAVPCLAFDQMSRPHWPFTGCTKDMQQSSDLYALN